jgi:hypothetical protein
MGWVETTNQIYGIPDRLSMGYWHILWYINNGIGIDPPLSWMVFSREKPSTG